MRTILAYGLAASAAFGSNTLTAQEARPLAVALELTEPREALPANTEVLLSVNQAITTKGKTWKEGDTFNLSVVHDVRRNGYVVIPRGSRGVGRITWMTSKGAFGKSGKMDIDLEYVEVAGQRIDLSGTYRQEGEGNTVATVGGVVLVGILGGVITGKSAEIPRGRELMAHTERDIPLALPSRQPNASPARHLTSASWSRETATTANSEADYVLPLKQTARNGSACVIFSTPGGGRATRGQVSQLQDAALERARADAGAELGGLSAKTRNESLDAMAAYALAGYSCAH